MKNALHCMGLLALLGTGLSATAQTADLPVPSDFVVGETWSWRRVDALTKLEESRSQRTVVKSDTGLQFSINDTTFSIPSRMVDGPYEPSSKSWRQWPLSLGKRWTFESTWTRPDGVSGKTEQKVEVAAYEEVTVPAGRFMAFRIEHRGFYNNSRGANGTQDDIYWYAPELRANIKHERRSGRLLWTEELTGYQRP